MATTQLKPPGNIYGVTANQPKPTGVTQQQINQANNYNKAQNNKGNPVIPAPTNTGVVNPTQSTYNAPSPFQFNYDYLNFDTAKQRAEDRYNPLFQQAVDGVKAQQYQNNLDSGQSAAVRGLAHSGLAQDALTKIAIASQGQIAGLNAQKMSNVADYAQSLLDKDQARGDALRSQMFNEYANNRDFGRNSFESDRNYGLAKSDQDFNHMNTNRYYDLDVNKNNFDQMDSNRNFKLNESGVTGTYNGQKTYQAQQDAINNALNVAQVTGKYNGQDTLAGKQFNADQYWKTKDWNEMSPHEKMTMAAELANSLKLKKADGGGGGGGNPYSNPYYVNEQPKLDLNKVNMDELMRYYQSVMMAQQGNPTVPYGSQAYIDKMKGLQY
jgi:hypothetical protein